MTSRNSILGATHRALDHFLRAHMRAFKKKTVYQLNGLVRRAVLV